MKRQEWFSLVLALGSAVFGGTGCCSAARRARAAAAAANVAPAAPAEPQAVEEISKPAWAVDFDFESGAAAGWKSEWGHLREVTAETRGENKLLACRWNPTEGFDLSATLGPPRDLSKDKKVCFQLYVPRSIALAGYVVKVWLDEKWPSGPNAVFSAADADRWKNLCVDVGGIDGVNYDLVNKVGIYLEPGPGARKVDGEVVVYLDNVGVS